MIKLLHRSAAILLAFCLFGNSHLRSAESLGSDQNPQKLVLFGAQALSPATAAARFRSFAIPTTIMVIGLAAGIVRPVLFFGQGGPETLRTLLIPKDLKPAQHLFVPPNGFSHAKETLAALPWLDQLYKDRIRRTADEALRLSFADSVPNTLESSEKYGPMLADLATVYGLTGDTQYQNQDIQLLMAIQKGFHFDDSFITANDSLDFSIYLVDMLYAYSLVQSGLSLEQKALLRNELFQPAGMELISHAYGSDVGGNPAVQLRHQKSNHLTAMEAALVADGLILGGQEGRAMLDYAVNNPHGGLVSQLRSSLLPGGVWWENSTAYHLYSFHFLLWASMALQNNGIDLYTFAPVTGGATIQQMAAVLLKLSDPNYALPYWGDSVGPNLRADYAALLLETEQIKPTGFFSHLLEHARFPSIPRAQTVLEEAIAPAMSGPVRRQPPNSASIVFPESGIAVLRTANDFSQPEGKPFVFFASPPTADNAHANGQNFLWFSLGGKNESTPLVGLLNDGFRDYDKPDIFGWRRGGGSGIVVDGQAQNGWKPFTHPDSNGRLLYFDGSTVEGITTNAFPVPITYDRQVSLTSIGLFDVIRAEAKTSAAVTLVIPGPPGSVLASPSSSGTTAPLPGNIFKALSGWKEAAAQASINFYWSASDVGTKVLVVSKGDENPASARTADAPRAQGKTQPVAFVTQNGRAVTFVTLFIPVPISASQEADAWSAQSLQMSSDRAAGMVIKGRRKTYLYTAIMGEPGEVKASNPSDPETFVIVRGKTGFVEVDPVGRSITVTGQVAGLSVPMSPGPAPTVVINGQPGSATLSGGHAVATTSLSEGPLTVRLLPSPRPTPPFPFGIAANPFVGQKAQSRNPSSAHPLAIQSGLEQHQFQEKDVDGVVAAMRKISDPSAWGPQLDKYKSIFKSLGGKKPTLSRYARIRLAAALTLPLGFRNGDTIRIKALDVFVQLARSGFLADLPPARGPLAENPDFNVRQARPLDCFVDEIIAILAQTQFDSIHQVAITTLQTMFFMDGASPTLIASRFGEIKTAIEWAVRNYPSRAVEAQSLLRRIEGYEKTHGKQRGATLHSPTHDRAFEFAA